ncbi:MAG: adenylate/guanylate cyclase domain-containing protein [Gammaproteobacteria bacterium]|nr:adenylate/guanylate cyclase domain-containing protein [Gammaproteobacteria bacterium]
MQHQSKWLIVGTLGGLLGALLGLSTWALKLEENTGLESLFHQRGAIPPPREIVIIALDKRSADQLGLPNESALWPRQLHADLVTKLTTAGVKSITYDMLFKTPRDPLQDRAFADAILAANNVILFEFMKKELATNSASPDMTTTIRRRIQPIPLLVDTAAALAPFPLPRVPLKVSQFWSFAPGAGDAATLPTATLQLYTLDAYDDFLMLLQPLAPQHIATLPATKQELLEQRKLTTLIHQLKRLFANEPTLLEKLTTAAQDSKQTFQNRDQLLALLRIYHKRHSHYLNYYGPPRTITTIPFYQIIQSKNSPEFQAQLANLKDKMIFIGYSAELQWEQKDGFYSVYSREDGLDISGVEIAATATANLLQGRSIQTLSPVAHFTILLLWGALIGMLAIQLSAVRATLAVLLLATGYFFLSLALFSYINLWLPLFIPLLIQAPLILFAGIIWKHLDTVRERRNMHDAFSNYLPKQEIDRLTRNNTPLAPGGELRYATCLYTDAAQYTQLSEQMTPAELGALMNRYYTTIFAPIHRHQGDISDVVGDAAMALWPSNEPSSTLRHAACCAAIDLIDAVERFNLENPAHQLPTRVGMHCGEILLGNVGAVGRFEYRATGDVVNTTSRIEGMNKLFKTRLLVSDDVLNGLDGFQTRPIGTFILAGKSRPISLHEMISLRSNASATQQQLCTQFSAALTLFKSGDWNAAQQAFNTLITTHQDHASHYYHQLCQAYQNTPPPAPWNGTINIIKK